MSDFRIQTSWRSSGKRRRLRRMLGADGILAIEDLWSYCSEPASNRSDGDLSGMSADHIADEVDWQGDPLELVGVLVACRLFDGQEGHYKIHDWHEHQPWVTAQKVRSLGAKRAVHERWAKRGLCRGGTIFCTLTCGRNTEVLRSVIRNDTPVEIRNTPLPNPIPNPSPDPGGGSARVRAHTREEISTSTQPPIPTLVYPEPGRTYSRGEAESYLVGQGWPPSAFAAEELHKLTPYQGSEILHAAERTRTAHKPGAGYFLSVIRGEREKPSKQSSPKNSSETRDIRYGYARPSKHEPVPKDHVRVGPDQELVHLDKLGEYWAARRGPQDVVDTALVAELYPEEPNGGQDDQGEG